MRVEDLNQIIIVNGYDEHVYSQPTKDDVKAISLEFDLDEDELKALIKRQGRDTKVLLIDAELFRDP